MEESRRVEGARKQLPRGCLMSEEQGHFVLLHTSVQETSVKIRVTFSAFLVITMLRYHYAQGSFEQG